MELFKKSSLDSVKKDIVILRNLMYKAKERVGSIDDPLVVEISQFLDLKLNQQDELMKNPIVDKMEECI